MNKILSFIVLFLLCLSSVSASVVTRYGSDFKIVGNEISFKVSDRLGSNRLTLDDDSIIAESNTLPYGQQLKNNNVKFGFTGKELDDTNNYYFNARYYDFYSGKFLGVDPVSDNHAYAFVSNNPMNYVDPTGAIETSSSDAFKFTVAHPMIAFKYHNGESLNPEEKIIALDWFSNRYETDEPYAYKHLQQYLHPENLVSSRSAEWYGDKGTEREGTMYPVYDVRPDFDKEGFNLDVVLSYASCNAKHIDKILELFNEGKEAMILVNGVNVNPLDFQSMGAFSVYVQKDLKSGKIVVRIKDKYDWFLDDFNEGKASEFSVFNYGVADSLNIKLQENSENGNVYMYGGGRYATVRIYDGYLDKMGQEYIMWSEWEITEEQFLEYFGSSDVSSSDE